MLKFFLQNDMGNSDVKQCHTVESGYQAHAPITLSGKKYALIKVYVLNKQVFKYQGSGVYINKENCIFYCTYPF